MPLVSSVFFMCLPDKVLIYGAFRSKMALTDRNRDSGPRPATLNRSRRNLSRGPARILCSVKNVCYIRD